MMKDIVNELAAGILIPAKDLRIAIENPRIDADEDKIKELASSLDANGQITPVIAYREGKLYQITAGGRRYRAMAMLGWTNEMVKVEVYAKDVAIHLGVAEQLAHEKLSRVEEVKIMSSYKDDTDGSLARLIGKSVPYVKQHRKVLELPETLIEQFFAGDFTYEQALGLTYFIGHDDMMDAMVDRIRDYPQTFDLKRIKQEFTRAFGEWDNHPIAQHITKEAYIKAGGILEEDLFGGSALIKSPEIVTELGTKAIEKKMKKLAPKGQTLIQAEDNEYLYHHPRHHGMNMLSEAQKNELNVLREQREASDESDFDLTNDLDNDIEALEEDENGHPADLLEMLVTYWKVDTRTAKGFEMLKNCFPEDMEPLYEAGYAERPSSATETAENAAESDEDAISQALSERIRAVQLHTQRQLLSHDPQAILNAYSDSLEGQSPLEVMFEFRVQQLPAVTLHYDKAFSKLQAVAEHADLKPAAVRDRLAYNLLVRVNHVDGRADNETIRKYFTPDADFLKAYKMPQLLMMMEAYPDRSLTSKDKKSTLVTVLAELAEKDKTFLPIGF